jgi:hypothetical protein
MAMTAWSAKVWRRSYLGVGESAGLGAVHRQRPDRLVATEQGHGDLAPNTTSTSDGLRGLG